MVTKFGMSDKLGNIDYAGEQFSYLGPQAGGVNAGPDTHELIDAEVRALVDEGYETARRILTEKRDDLERLANGLLEYETLTGKEIGRVIAGLPLNRGGDDDDTKADSGPTGHRRDPEDRQAAAEPRRRSGAEARDLRGRRFGLFEQTRADRPRGFFFGRKRPRQAARPFCPRADKWLSAGAAKVIRFTLTRMKPSLTDRVDAERGRLDRRCAPPSGRSPSASRVRTSA